jgi:hypothetical protein
MAPIPAGPVKYAGCCWAYRQDICAGIPALTSRHVTARGVGDVVATESDEKRTVRVRTGGTKMVMRASMKGSMFGIEFWADARGLGS